MAVLYIFQKITSNATLRHIANSGESSKIIPSYQA